MNISTKKSHCFSLAVGGGLAGGLWFSQLIVAMLGSMAWAEVVIMLVLQLFVGILVAGSVHLVWIYVANEMATSYDKPKAYTPDLPVLLGLGFVVAALTLIFAGAAPLLAL